LVRKPKKPKQKPTPAAKAKGQAKAKRQAKKHQSVHKALRLKVWLGFFIRQLNKIPKTIRIPGVDHVVDTRYVIGFCAALSVAIVGGYMGAQALFGTSERSQVLEPQIIQQSRDITNVILPEPNSASRHAGRAYEEKVIDEVYLPETTQIKPPSTPEPQIATLTPPMQKPIEQPLWMQNAIDFKVPKGKPMVAIVIDDMGVDRKRSKRMWENVPGPLTLSFMTYANDLLDQTKAAHAKGHELMLHMSMEPSNPTIDAGPNVLLAAMGDAEIQKIVTWGLDRFSGFVGVNNHMGSLFTENVHGMKVVLNLLKQRGLLFLDSRTSPRSMAGKIARKMSMPVLERNVFLDNDNEIDKVLKQLNEVERLARNHGVAIAIGHPREATIQVLKTWIPEALNRGLAIVPISAVMKQHLNQN